MHSLFRRTTFSCAAVIAAATLLAACGGGGGDKDVADYKEPKGPAVQTVNIQAGNLYFKPKEFSVQPGIIKFDLTNVETGTHDLVIKGIPGFQVRVSGEGDEAALKVDLPKAGKYDFYCSIPGHAEAGMKGIFTVK